MCAPLGTARAVAEKAERSFEVADIIRAHGEEFRRTHRLAGVQERAMQAIVACRTEALGGCREVCDQCGEARVRYHSCRNRHCPKCQALAQRRWVEQRSRELLPIEHFQVIFTLPHRLNPLAQGNPRVIYDLLFRAASETLLEFGRDPKHVGGELGFIAVLHTWGQDLSQHLHLHCLVPGGALSPDGTRFVLAHPHFLFPVQALSQVFRGKFLDGLREAFQEGKLRFAEGTAGLARPETLAVFLQSLREHKWVVFAEGSSSDAGPLPLVEYLARYTCRVAISNDRIVDFEDGQVRFRYKDYAAGGCVKTMALPAGELIRRLLLHVLPPGFVRVRHFGFLANRHRRRKLDLCLAHLYQPPLPPAPPPETAAQMLIRLTGADLSLCPSCGKGRMRVVAMLPRLSLAFCLVASGYDSS